MRCEYPRIPYGCLSYHHPIKIASASLDIGILFDRTVADDLAVWITAFLQLVSEVPVCISCISLFHSPAMDADHIYISACFSEELHLCLSILFIDSYPGLEAERHGDGFAQGTDNR